MLEVNLDLNFSPEARKREHLLVREAQKAIKESDKIPEEEKSSAIDSWYSYLFAYEREFFKYQRQIKEECEAYLREKTRILEMSN